jgi:hypothetical protein
MHLPVAVRTKRDRVLCSIGAALGEVYDMVGFEVAPALGKNDPVALD